MQYIFLINIRIHFKSADHEGSPQISGLAGCEVNYPALTGRASRFKVLPYPRVEGPTDSKSPPRTLNYVNTTH